MMLLGRDGIEQLPTLKKAVGIGTAGRCQGLGSGSELVCPRVMVLFFTWLLLFHFTLLFTGLKGRGPVYRLSARLVVQDVIVLL